MRHIRSVTWATTLRPTPLARTMLRSAVPLAAVLAVLVAAGRSPAQAQLPAPSVSDPDLTVRTVITGQTTPVQMAFIGPDDFLLLEKNTGKVKRVTGGVVQGTVLDLPVNSASERGLLGIALHPDFRQNGFVYLYWTESSTGRDSSKTLEVPLLGNRVDRFIWNGSTLNMDRNLIRLHAFQADAGQPPAGNHNGGVIRFGPEGQAEDDQGDDSGVQGDDNGDRGGQGAPDEQGDEGDQDRGDPMDGQGNGGGARHGHRSRSRGAHGCGHHDTPKLYIIIGDNGRRGQTQNLPLGPFMNGAPDDPFGGPQPDDAHLTGVILRLNDDGTTPEDNPFFEVGAEMGGEVGANIQKIFAYGIRNSFGMAFDPHGGRLWTQENGDDSFDEINQVNAGFNGGWVQVMGPLSRIQQYKQIETSPQFFGLQQVRWSPVNIADTPAEALSRMWTLPGSRYTDPRLSWKFAVAPAGIGFLNSRALGRQYEGNLFVGAARTFLQHGYLFRLQFTRDRKDLAFSDPRLADRVADNGGKFDGTESESLMFGQNFGVGTDVETDPDGNLYVVSLSNGAVYEIMHK